MWTEHDEQRKEIKEASKTLENKKSLELEGFKRKLLTHLKNLTDLIPNHFYKEENILFPSSLRLIGDREWQEIRASMDDLGYCYFTPKEAIGEKVELAKEEDLHMKKIMEVYRDLEDKGKWEERITVVGNPERVKTVFAEAMARIDKDIKASAGDLEALKRAMDLEQRGQNLYNDLAEKAADPLEKRFYLTLATEERGHFLLILDSYDYLSDPAGWFAQKERSLLDGGS